MVRVSLRPPRCYLGRHRVHHGLVGLILLLHDVRDAPRWLRDLIGRP